MDFLDSGGAAGPECFCLSSLLVVHDWARAGTYQSDPLISDGFSKARDEPLGPDSGEPLLWGREVKNSSAVRQGTHL